MVVLSLLIGLARRNLRYSDDLSAIADRRHRVFTNLVEKPDPIGPLRGLNRTMESIWTTILFQCHLKEKDAIVVSVCAQHDNAGTSISTLDLARLFAQSGKRTLILDTCFSESGISGLLGMHGVSASDSKPRNTSTPNLSYFYSGIDEPAIDSIDSTRISGLLDRYRLSYEAIIIDSALSKPVIPNLVLANLPNSIVLVSTPKTPKTKLRTMFGDLQSSNIQSVIHLYNEASMNDPEAARHLSNLDNPSLLGDVAQNLLMFKISEETTVTHEVRPRNGRLKSTPYPIRIGLHKDTSEAPIEIPDGVLTETAMTSTDSNQKLIAQGIVESIDSNTYLMVTEYVSPKDPLEFRARLDRL